MTSGQRPALAEQLDLERHPEGGWFRETWRCEHSFHPAGYPGPRAAATAIYYVLGAGEVSRWHVVLSDEVWFWHRGGPLTLRLGGNGEGPDELAAVEFTLGPDIAAGHRPQVVIPGGVWQSAAPAQPDAVLVSCVVAPGFDYADFRLA